ncbi:MAG TPA: NAD-dependent succinate-semialdehyde dehydrogenase [Anaeromyxobacteraceae bacterium]|jgi:succinate-semialdehyde dehydrogenase/glutarate-semialdehyde dehydrogenase|nr:NAD-dependent succinate-semialdehyde dehydrogenase [Anaeromyxobacteraceae bacterium]
MTIESLSPATGERLATFEETPAAEVDRILTAAVRAQRAWARTPFAERAVPMRRVAALLRERAQEYAKLMALEMGKPLKDGAAEVTKCGLVCEYYADHAERHLAPREEASDAGRSYVRFDPLGVVLAVMPWNFPYWQVFRFIAPHLMAGNGGLLKHASNVPQCALSIERVMHDAGFPKDLFRTLLVGSKAVRNLILDDRIAAATITGSEPAGRSVAAAAGEALKPSVLELGGSDPFIVLADADLEQAARTAAVARTINAGQSCICAKRFIVEAPVYEAFLEKLTAAMKAIRMGDPLDPTSDIGPQARLELRDELQSQVTQAIEGGARKVLGCEVPPGPGAFYPPSILADVPRGNLAAREELFGPVAVVMRAGSADEAVEIANDSRFGLGASLWTRSQADIERLVPRIEAGAVFVNGMVKSDPRLPFGGVKTSGYGRELGLEGIRAFVNTKTVWIK